MRRQLKIYKRRVSLRVPALFGLVGLEWKIKLYVMKNALGSEDMWETINQIKLDYLMLNVQTKSMIISKRV